MPEFEKSDEEEEEEEQVQTGQASVDSEIEQLLKEVFGCYDVGSQRINYDRQNWLKMIEAERKKSQAAVTQTFPTELTRKQRE